MRTYELHTFTNGQWAFNFVFGDSDTALEEARRLDKAGKHSAVCVTEEDFDESTNVARSRTIFRVGETGAARPPAARRTTRDLRQDRPSATGSGGIAYARGDAAPGRLTVSGVCVPILLLAALFFAGAGALYGLQQMMM